MFNLCVYNCMCALYTQIALLLNGNYYNYYYYYFNGNKQCVLHYTYMSPAETVYTMTVTPYPVE